MHLRNTAAIMISLGNPPQLVIRGRTADADLQDFGSMDPPCTKHCGRGPTRILGMWGNFSASTENVKFRNKTFPRLLSFKIRFQMLSCINAFQGLLNCCVEGSHVFNCMHVALVKVNFQCLTTVLGSSIRQHGSACQYGYRAITLSCEKSLTLT
jgi:hypothetical protein